MTSQKKKKPVLAIKYRIFQSLNNHTFSKGQKILVKKCQFFGYLDLVKM